MFDRILNAPLKSFWGLVEKGVKIQNPLSMFAVQGLINREGVKSFLEDIFWAVIPVNRYKIRSGYGPIVFCLLPYIFPYINIRLIYFHLYLFPSMISLRFKIKIQACREFWLNLKRCNTFIMIIVKWY